MIIQWLTLTGQKSELDYLVISATEDLLFFCILKQCLFQSFSVSNIKTTSMNW